MSNLPPHVTQRDIDEFMDDPLGRFIDSELEDGWHPSIEEAYTDYVERERSTPMRFYDWMNTYDAFDIARMVREYDIKQQKGKTK
jgi:hypothetical protein